MKKRYGSTASPWIGKITTSGTVTEYSLPKGNEPYRMIFGPDGNLWFTEYEGPEKRGWVGKMTTSGTSTEYALPEGSHPIGITRVQTATSGSGSQGTAR